MAKQMMFDQDAMKKVLDGVRQLARAVKVTLGPTGKHVILEKKWGSPTVTKDGVSVSKEVELPDPFENMGAKLVIQAASKTSDVAGDGPTTATDSPGAIEKLTSERMVRLPSGLLTFLPILGAARTAAPSE